MQKVTVSDITLRESEKNNSLSFKEKIDVVKKLDKLNVSVIETGKITNKKTDTLFLHTISPLIKNSTLSCPVDYSEESIEATYDAIKSAKSKRLHLMVPVSSVQMEYLCHKKPKAILEMIDTLTKKCASLCDDVEFSALDATRSERDFLYKSIETAISSGAKTITVCDSAGEMMPNEFKDFILDLYKNVPSLNDVMLSVECNNSLHMAVACLISSITVGARQFKVTASKSHFPSLLAVAKILQTRGGSMDVSLDLNFTELEHTIDRMGFLKTGIAADSDSATSHSDEIVLSENDSIDTLSAVILKMGYDLSEDDIKNVYEEFLKIAKSKPVKAKELDAIIASSALQVAPTFKLKSYVINSGNVINSSAVMVLLKDGNELEGMSVGDGPIDAAFMCIEKIVGRHFELDDFQIQSVTEGREAMGVTVVKLRSDGKLYSGKGVSTDIVESSINAYINAINKILFEEE
ncbi:MAG: hypothetical protein E7417_05245 [Ruminococcaceae bacterium]|nr:hypothetical protein [Oscillospiraceae bacterium]